jgi:hypothetical protein
MADKTIETIERLEQLAAWRRVTAERAGSAWVWEARLLAAEDLERQVADARARLQSGEMNIGRHDTLRAVTDCATPQPKGPRSLVRSRRAKEVFDACPHTAVRP